MPFSQEIMDSVVPANTVAVKASFTGVILMIIRRVTGRGMGQGGPERLIAHQGMSS